MSWKQMYSRSECAVEYAAPHKVKKGEWIITILIMKTQYLTCTINN